jgi:hypothetical protein
MWEREGNGLKLTLQTLLGRPGEIISLLFTFIDYKVTLTDDMCSFSNLELFVILHLGARPELRAKTSIGRRLSEKTLKRYKVRYGDNVSAAATCVRDEAVQRHETRKRYGDDGIKEDTVITFRR